MFFNFIFFDFSSGIFLFDLTSEWRDRRQKLRPPLFDCFRFSTFNSRLNEMWNISISIKLNDQLTLLNHLGKWDRHCWLRWMGRNIGKLWVPVLGWVLKFWSKFYNLRGLMYNTWPSPYKTLKKIDLRSFINISDLDSNPGISTLNYFRYTDKFLAWIQLFFLHSNLKIQPKLMSYSELPNLFHKYKCLQPRTFIIFSLTILSS